MWAHTPHGLPSALGVLPRAGRARGHLRPDDVPLVAEAGFLHDPPRDAMLSGRVNATTSAQPEPIEGDVHRGARQLGADALAPAIGGHRPADLDLVAAADVHRAQAPAGHPFPGGAVAPYPVPEVVALPQEDVLVEDERGLRGGAHAAQRGAHGRVAEQPRHRTPGAAVPGARRPGARSRSARHRPPPDNDKT